MPEAEAKTGLESILEGIVRRVLREELAAMQNGHSERPLLSPEKLAGLMDMPVSWVYEQSRQGKIPKHKIGKYIRFNLGEVLESQKKNGGAS